MVENNLDDPKPYWALSYCWGTGTPSQPLVCGNSVIFITLNSEYALRSLRKRRSTISIWIDTICIDQTNVPEKDS